MRILSVVVSVCLLSGVSAPALADAQSYCELLSRDYADGKTLDVDQWQLNFRSAFNSCMVQYTPSLPDPPKSKSPDKVVRKAVATAVPEAPRKKRIPLLAPGSVAWNEYCAAKYISYNKETGMYKSYSGKPKPCLVPTG